MEATTQDYTALNELYNRYEALTKQYEITQDLIKANFKLIKKYNSKTYIS